jgi:hypothetical protein
LTFVDAQFRFGGFGGRINAQLPGLGGLNVNNIQIPGHRAINEQVPNLNEIQGSSALRPCQDGDQRST